MNIKKLNLVDIVFSGALASYNWNEYSDVDLYVILDLKNFEKHKGFVLELLKTKKTSWQYKNNITINNHQIELYFQDKDEKFENSGAFSLIKNKWILTPTKQQQIDKKLIMRKYQDIVGKILYIEEQLNKSNFDIERIKKEIEFIVLKLKNDKKLSSEKISELSIENFVFNLLKTNGFIEKLYEIKNKINTISVKNFSF